MMMYVQVFIQIIFCLDNVFENNIRVKIQD